MDTRGIHTYKYTKEKSSHAYILVEHICKRVMHTSWRDIHMDTRDIHTYKYTKET